MAETLSTLPRVWWRYVYGAALSWPVCLQGSQTHPSQFFLLSLSLYPDLSISFNFLLHNIFSSLLPFGSHNYYFSCDILVYSLFLGYLIGFSDQECISSRHNPKETFFLETSWSPTSHALASVIQVCQGTHEKLL